jgi:hypothetical protein
MVSLSVSKETGPCDNPLIYPSDPAKSGKLFPDGVYSEQDSTPMYNYRPSNFNHFTVSMWLKPNFFPEDQSKIRTYLTYQTTAGYPFGIYSFAFEQGERASAYDTEKGWNIGFIHTAVQDGYFVVSDNPDNASLGVWARGAEPGNPTIKDGGNPLWSGGMITPCLNHLNCGLAQDWWGIWGELIMPGYDPLPHDAITRFGQKWGTMFRAGKWIHLAWVHDAHPLKTDLRINLATTGYGLGGCITQMAFDSSQVEPVDIIYVNGTKCTGPFDLWQMTMPTAHVPNLNTVGDNLLYQTGAAGNLLRLGERSSHNFLNGAPDATLDEVIIWKDIPDTKVTTGTMTVTEFDTDAILAGIEKDSYYITKTVTGAVINPGLDDAENAVQKVWQDGRYYRGNGNDRGCFTSRPIDLADAAGISGMPVTVFMVAWTQYVPYKVSPYEGAGVVDLRDKGATCRIDLTDSSKNPAPLDGWLPNDPGALKDPGGSPVKIYGGKDLVVDFPIRYRVYFDLGSVNPVNDIIIDPLIFDDITIIYYSVPKFLSWAYRR